MKEKNTEKDIKDIFNTVDTFWLERHSQSDPESHQLSADYSIEYSLSNYEPIWNEESNGYKSPATYDGCEYLYIILDNNSIQKLGIEDLNMPFNSLVTVTDVTFEDIESSFFLIIYNKD